MKTKLVYLFILMLAWHAAVSKAQTVTIISPTANQKWSNEVFTVTGKAADSVAISNVWVSLNGGSLTNATLSNGSNGSSNWTQQVSLIPGTNTIAVFVVDISSRVSKTNTVKLIYFPSTTLVVSINGKGTLTPNYNGATLKLGANYAMAAKAAKGFAFTNWTDGLGGVITNGATLKFLMASNLTFVANFKDIAKPTLSITNPIKTGAKWSNLDFTISGKAADNVAISNILFSLNGADWASVTNVTNGGSNWTQQVSLIPGTNTITAYAVDTSGNVSTTNTTKVIYILTTTLAVGINGNGTITPNYNGALLQLGASYAMAAKAATGFGFVNWTDGLENVITNGATLKFIMASNLTFVANFADIAKPTLSITAPTANQKWSNADFTVTGKAADNVAISNVLVSVNGADWVSAGESNWTTQASLIPGTNTIAAYAVDTSGNVSTTNTVKLVYVVDTRTLVGSWNLIQFRTPAQITGDANDGLQGGDKFSVTNGSLIINSNGTFSGNVNGQFTGTYASISNGVVTVVINSEDGTDTNVFYVNAGKDTMTSINSQNDADNNRAEMIVAQRAPVSFTAAAIAGSWNMVQFQTSAQITDDTTNGLQGGSSFSATNGNITFNANGTLSGKLGNTFTGTFTISSNGMINASIISGDGPMPITFFLNFSKDTLTEMDSQNDTNNNQQEIIFAQREPASVKAADIAGSWNLVQFQTPAQITEDNNGLQGNSNFSVTNGTMTINANGTLSGNLGDVFTGTFTIGSAGVIHTSIHSGGGIMPITFYLNAGKDTMTEVDSENDSNNNQQQIVIAHRVPAN